MKILMANKYFYEKGGPEKVVFDTARLLERRGHQVIYFSMKHPLNLPSLYEKYFVSNVDYDTGGPIAKLRAGLRILYSFEAAKKMSRLIEKERPDIAHLHNIQHQISPSIVYALKKFNVPIVMTLHDYKLVCASYLMLREDACELCKDNKYYYCFLKRCFKGSALKSLLATAEMILHHKVMRVYELIDLFLSPSMFLKNKIEEMGFKGKIEYLPNFIEAKDIIPQFDWRENSIIYFGRLSPWKGILTLIEAVKCIPNVLLKIIGDGPLRDAIISKIEKEKISNVRLIGHKGRKDLEDEIKRCRGVVVPSEWYENNPRVILEAFALGKPVIGSRIGGIPELVKDGMTGLLFEPKNVKGLRNRIEELLSGGDRIIEMGKNARKMVEDDFNEDKHYGSLINIYDQVIMKKSRGG